MNIVSWNVTNRCDLSCPHCYRDAGLTLKNELSTEEAFDLIDNIKKAGFKLMIFSGGEPLLREDIYELINYASTSGLRPVLGTNGGLIDKENAIKLKKAGLMAAGISLDSLVSEKHDKFRGSKGLFSRVEEAFNNLKEVKIPFQIHMTVMDWNQDEVEDLIDYSQKVGARAAHIFFLVPTGRGEYIEEKSLDSNRYHNLVEKVMKKSENAAIEVKPVCAPQFIPVAEKLGIKTRFKTGCLAGSSYCLINPVGEVQPCAYLNMVAGNIREEDFSTIWKESEIFNKLRSQDFKGDCGKCSYKKNCRGCRARAYYYSGDYMASDPFCTIY
ncbi:MAG: putative heme d1 biosynthesis radical SAM protein NirJ2 [Bacillota bacterium]